MKQTITVINPGKAIGQMKNADRPQTKGGGPEFDCPFVIDYPVHSVPTRRS
jgi:hypothetical protein